MQSRLAALALGLVATLPAADPQRPNIVLIMADDQGWCDTGYSGPPELKTPNLDDTANSGHRRRPGEHPGKERVVRNSEAT